MSPGAPPVAKRSSHVRSKSMKEQLAQFGQESSKEGTPKTLQSLQEIISSLKNLPPSTTNNSGNTFDNNNNNASNNSGNHGISGSSSTSSLSRHEKRLSMSSLPSRSSVLSASTSSPSVRESPFPTTTTLHISQPPRGTTIENALQSTVATLRRLSVSDSKRPVIPGKKDESDVSYTTIVPSTNTHTWPCTYVLAHPYTHPNTHVHRFLFPIPCSNAWPSGLVGWACFSFFLFLCFSLFRFSHPIALSPRSFSSLWD